MALDKSFTQDRRQNSRIPTCLSCRCAFQGVSREAVILNLSLTGALISANLRPPVGSTVTLTLQTPLLKSALILEGKVARMDPAASERGIVNRFGMRFSKSSLDLITLINNLTSQQT